PAMAIENCGPQAAPADQRLKQSVRHGRVIDLSMGQINDGKTTTVALHGVVLLIDPWCHWAPPAASQFNLCNRPTRVSTITLQRFLAALRRTQASGSGGLLILARRRRNLMEREWQRAGNQDC